MMTKLTGAVAFSLATMLVACTVVRTNPSASVPQWQNPDTASYNTVAPIGSTGTGAAECREYQQTITIAGQTQQAYGTACKRADGSWRVVP